MPVTQDPFFTLRQLFDAAVARAMPQQVLASFLPTPPTQGRTLVLGAGKAGGAMAVAMEAAWPLEAPMAGLVITRYDHVPPAYNAARHRIEVVEAAHPVPDAAGLAATQRLAALAQGLTAHDLVVCLISGGGSALLTMPAQGLRFADKQAINQALLQSGAAIDEMNTVRKHLSAIKGGRLAARCAPARVVTLAISDVPGDDPSVIASGPTVPDASTSDEALAILKRHRVPVPEAILHALASGALETPKPGDACFAGHEVKVIATPAQSLQAAATLAAGPTMGLRAHVMSDAIEGESRHVGAVHAALAKLVQSGKLSAEALAALVKDEPEGSALRRAVLNVPLDLQAPCVLLSGGETTVTVRPAPGVVLGRGGRAGEFLLGCAQALQAQPGIWALAADTDGIDGMEHNAGARVAPNTLARASAQSLHLHDHLARHDSFGYFDALGDLVVSGPTFTNVNDFRALLILHP